MSATATQQPAIDDRSHQLVVRDLEVRARKRGGDVSIASGIDLTVAPGEAVAIVGESGSGKSLTARAIMGLLPEGVSASGDVRLGELSLLDLGSRRRRAMRGSEIALVMQDPFTMLNPVVACGKQIVEALARKRGRGMRGAAAREEAVRRLAQVGIDDPTVADRYPFELSGGMRQRVAIAAAIAEEPRLLIADEPTTALDVTTQREILRLLAKLQQEQGMSLILITHDLRVGFEVCDRVYVLYAGSLVETAPVKAIEENPCHPYTLGLLHAEPPIDRRLERLVDIPGWVPPPGSREEGCPFAPRCQWATEKCVAAMPPLRELSSGRWTRCVRVEEIGDEMIRAELAAAVETQGGSGSRGEMLVEARNVRKEFAARSRGGSPVTALEDASIHVRAGESVGLVGESGSGKTTLGRIIVGLEQGSGGEMQVGGVEVIGRELSGAEAEQRRQTAQMAFQDPYSSLNPARTVGKALGEAIRLAGGRDEAAEVASLLDRVGLPAHYAERRPVGLSGGERQRVAIARALARKPRLLICDEVVSALDVSVQAQILNLLEDIRRELGTSYLFITHDLAVVRQITDRIYVLKNGCVVEEGGTAAVLDGPQHPYTRELIAAVPG